MPDIFPAWIALDWGTSNLRAWAMDDDNGVLAETESPDGMGTLAPEAFEPALLKAISGWLGAGRRVPVIACGMVGARQGWIEAPYISVPVTPGGDSFTLAPTTDPRIAVMIIAGLSQAEPADVMRGEETQVAGFAAENGGDGVLCLPGTHSKWVRLDKGVITRFNTMMTGEVFAMLTTHSVLRHSVAGEGWDEAAFARGVSESLANPTLLAQLFSIRAEQLLTGQTAVAAKSRLSGLLIGAEVAGTRDYWQGRTTVLIGASRLVRLYETALDMAGGQSQIADGGSLTLSGLVSAYERWKVTA
ncbi:2-dehydro-3-deoxygalactonokinase [Pelagibacterium lacus]|nr:2-dehydro-3-deoxygalactonokinase [Pelagibacterium lacus]